MSSFYEMRLESIGGLGAHLAGQILAEAGVLGMNLNGAHFSSYGSEKKGSPVKSYVRLGPPDKSLRVTSPCRTPDLVAIFHEALMADPGVTAGLLPGATLIVNSTESAAAVARKVGVAGVRVITLDAIDIAVQEKTRVNTAMLGAIASACPVLEMEAIRKAISDVFGRKDQKLVVANVRTFERGATEIDEYTLGEDELAGLPEKPAARPGVGAALGWKTQPIGGILKNSGSTIMKDISASRQGFLPVFKAELCVHCAICDLVCPDYCFVWEPSGKEINGYPALKLQGIDYQFCKGCMHCVSECPTGALVKEREIGDMAKQLNVALPMHQAVGVPEGAGILAKSGWGTWDTPDEGERR